MNFSKHSTQKLRLTNGNNLENYVALNGNKDTDKSPLTYGRVFCWSGLSLFMTVVVACVIYLATSNYELAKSIGVVIAACSIGGTVLTLLEVLHRNRKQKKHEQQ